MNAARNRLAVAESTATLTTDFDLPTVLDTIFVPPPDLTPPRHINT